jgi:hypothetical protein
MKVRGWSDNFGENLLSVVTIIILFVALAGAMWNIGWLNWLVGHPASWYYHWWAYPTIFIALCSLLGGLCSLLAPLYVKIEHGDRFFLIVGTLLLAVGLIVQYASQKNIEPDWFLAANVRFLPYCLLLFGIGFVFYMLTHLKQVGILRTIARLVTAAAMFAAFFIIHTDSQAKIMDAYSVKFYDYRRTQPAHDKAQSIVSSSDVTITTFLNTYKRYLFAEIPNPYQASPVPKLDSLRLAHASLCAQMNDLDLPDTIKKNLQAGMEVRQDVMERLLSSTGRTSDFFDLQTRVYEESTRLLRAAADALNEPFKPQLVHNLQK